MNMKVAVTSESGVTPDVIGVLENAGVEVVQRACNTAEEVIETARDADAMLVAIRPLTDRRILEALPKVKAICRNGVGVDSVDLEAATELGICVCNSPGVNTTEVADHAMALLLSITRQIPQLDEKVKAGAWSDRPSELSGIRQRLSRIAGSTVGIAGFGNIGQAFASRIRGFGPGRIIAHDPFTPQTTADLSGVRLCEFDELLAGVGLHFRPHAADRRHAAYFRARGVRKNEAFCRVGQHVPRSGDRWVGAPRGVVERADRGLRPRRDGG